MGEGRQQQVEEAGSPIYSETLAGQDSNCKLPRTEDAMDQDPVDLQSLESLSEALNKYGSKLLFLFYEHIGNVKVPVPYSSFNSTNN